MADMMECAEEMARALKAALPHMSKYAVSVCMMGGDRAGTPDGACEQMRAALARYEASK